jgi:pimeloyl-ACP methyl ester carboxylesterase
MEYREHMVPRGRYRIYAKDYPGEEPAIVLMHGFPDNLHLYDRLVPHLSSRRVVVFDFLGWGRSDKPEGYSYTDYLDRKLYAWQVGRFIGDEEVRNEVVPFLYSEFREARPAFWALNEDLFRTVLSRREMIPKMRTFARPLRIIFGDADPYLNRGVARRFHELFPTSELLLLPDARHYVQIDEPEEVARLILSMPLARRMGSVAGTST